MHAAPWSPQVDLLEREKDYLLKVALSEVYKSNICLTIRAGILLIQGARIIDDNIKSVIHSEREYGNFSRSVQLSSNIDTEKISAEYDDGILYINFANLKHAISDKFVSINKEDLCLQQL